MSHCTLADKVVVLPDPAPAISTAGRPTGWFTAASCSSFNVNCGIYAILNTANGKRYIGSAVNFQKRWNAHLHYLRKGVHHSSKLQRSWNKHGEQAFQFEVLMNCTRDSLFYYEEPLISQFDSTINGYNVEKLVRGRRVCSPETRAKIGEASHKRGQTQETRQKLSRLKKGKLLSEAHKAALRGPRGKLEKVRLAKLGTNNPNFGKPRSEETRQRIAEGQIGKPRYGNHKRWHTDRGISSTTCIFCITPYSI